MAPTMKRVSMAVALAVFSTGGTAETWVYTPVVELGVNHDDNFRLTAGPHESVTGTNLRAGILLNRVSDELSFDGRAIFDFNQYDGDRIPNENNQFFNAKIAKKLELDTFDLFASYKRDTTLKDVEPDFDLDDPTLLVDPDAGITTTRIRRNTLRIGPSWKRRLDELTSLNLAYEYRSRDYKSDQTANLNDFITHRLKGTLNRNLTERDVASFGLEYLNYDSDAVNADYDSYSATIGLDHHFSETTRGGFRVGLRRTEGDTDDDTGVVYELHGLKKTELALYTAKLQRRLSPTGSGDLNETDQLLLKMKRSLSPTLDLNIRARYFMLDSNNDANDRDYLEISPELSWGFEQWWSLNFSYAYRRQEYDLGNRDADSNAVFLSVSYAKPSGPVK